MTENGYDQQKSTSLCRKYDQPSQLETSIYIGIVELTLHLQWKYLSLLCLHRYIFKLIILRNFIKAQKKTLTELSLISTYSQASPVMFKFFGLRLAAKATNYTLTIEIFVIGLQIVT